jgi:hypothetical protein
MRNKIKITESQLLDLQISLYEQSQEQRNSHDSDLPIKMSEEDDGIRGRISYDDLDSLKKINRLVSKQEVIDWFNYMDLDYFNMTDMEMYIKYIDHNLNSVLNDTDDEFQERNYGVED